MKDYHKRKAYWEAFIIVFFNKINNVPTYRYGWWIARLSLIKKGEI